MRTRLLLAAVMTVAACSHDNTGPGVPLPTPTGLLSTSLDGAVALTWDDDAFRSDPNRFQRYQVYSTTYDLDANTCGSSYTLEGTTVAPEFVVGALNNGVPRCFAVSAVAVDGTESARSAPRNDTPRPDSRNVVVNVRQSQDAGSGFRFWDDLNGDGRVQANELGLLRNGSDLSIDFSVERDNAGVVSFVPVRPNVTLAYFNPQSPFVADLTSIDIAPTAGFARGGLPAVPGYGYVFQMPGPDGFARFGAIRPQHVGQTFVILDWSYQTDPGNPELKVGRSGF
jgi:hypothetical protein